ncbi:Pentatricopeptide repeat-containing protein, mitochondrial [Glycine max]|nr:Pentatricopeptide repeat-containing protein, mitochondrial [Glycine max]
MSERNVVTWNAMICGLGAYGYVDDVLDLREWVVVPNGVTFVGVLSACCHAGLIDVGCEIFRSMKSHYGCLVDLHGRGGRLLEAVELVKEMLWKADMLLLAASTNSGNTEVAERVVKEILALEPQNNVVLAALSNMQRLDTGRKF